MNQLIFKRIQNALILFAGAWILFKANEEFYHIAWGTGVWYGQFSLKWALAFFLFVLLSVLGWLIMVVGLWSRRLRYLGTHLIAFRERVKGWRWAFLASLIGFPVLFLQYSPWGIVFSGIYIRILIWAITAYACGVLLTKSDRTLLGFSGFLYAVLLTGTTFALAAPFMNVTDYPFTLGWSEGNRMWDYSLLFRSDLYDFPADHPPFAYLDLPRQLNGGLPFLLFHHVTILQERLWLALMAVLPYILLGWVTFRSALPDQKIRWLLAGLWAFMYLGQGPIHAPLLWAAILVALAWRKPLWLALPLVAFSGYVAQAVRFTWMFAPAMWAAMLELCSASHEQARFFEKDWGRSISVGVAGIFGGYFLPGLLPALLNFTRSGFQAASIPAVIAAPVTAATVTTTVSRQPLLWYRLLPNATYGNGILLGLLFATGPVIAVLLCLVVTRRWVLNLWQKMVIILVLLAFFIAGIIVSAKIGGGGDLHNMDMFIVGLMFAVALAWRDGAAQWIDSAQGSPMWVRLVVVLAIAIPAYGPLLTMRPLSFAKDLNWIVTLTKVESKDLGSLPSDRTVGTALETVRRQVKDAQSRGEVLFMDHRQLLTFGYIQDVPLVSEYEKKRMMDEALSGDAGYFEPYYKDLAAHRFTLIVSDPLRAPIKDSDYQFGEENNAWVKWVVRPTLCYYEPIETIPEVRLQLLVPKQESSDCSEFLP